MFRDHLFAQIRRKEMEESRSSHLILDLLLSFSSFFSFFDQSLDDWNAISSKKMKEKEKEKEEEEEEGEEGGKGEEEEEGKGAKILSSSSSSSSRPNILINEQTLMNACKEFSLTLSSERKEDEKRKRREKEKKREEK